MEFSAELMNVAPDNSSIPGFASLSEFGMYTIASVEESYNNLMYDIGINELAAVMEANGDTEKSKEKFSVKAIIDKFVGWVKDLWSKFIALVKKCRDYIVVFIGEKVVAVQAKLKKVDLKVLKEFIQKSEDDKWKSLKSYYDLSIDDVNDYVDANNQIMGKSIEYCNKIKDGKGADIKVEDMEKEIYKPLINLIGQRKVGMTDLQAATDIANLKANMFGNICPEITFNKVAYAKKYVLEHIDGLYANYVKDKDSILKLIDKSYKKPYNEFKKDLDKAIREAKKANTGKELKPLFASVKTVSKISNVIINTIADAVVKCAAYDIRVLYKCISLMPVSQKESAVIESTTFQSEL